MIRKQLLILSVLCFTGLTAFAQNGNFRSLASGNWNDPNSWERDSDGDGSFEDSPSDFSPVAADGTIVIRNGHTITVTATVSVDEITIQSGGIVTVNNGFSWSLANGSGDEITLNAGGTINNNGTINFALSQ